MKRISIVVLLLCECLVSVAWGQQPAHRGDWTEFLRTNMQRSNPHEHVLNVNNVGSLQVKVELHHWGRQYLFFARSGKWGCVCWLGGR
jgi:hypothetical protein